MKLQLLRCVNEFVSKKQFFEYGSPGGFCKLYLKLRTIPLFLSPGQFLTYHFFRKKK